MSQSSTSPIASMKITTLCDTVTVFKDGRVVTTMAKREMTRAALVRAIVGRDIAPAPAPILAHL